MRDPVAHGLTTFYRRKHGINNTVGLSLFVQAGFRATSQPGRRATGQ
jgi:hypothetical protein